MGLIFLALGAMFWHMSKSIVSVALVSGLVGITIKLASNISLTMLSLSKQYSFATSEVQKDALLSAGQAILATNDPLATFPGTSAYVSLLLIALAGLLFSVLMLSTNRITAIVGLFASGCDLVYCLTFTLTPLFPVYLFLATAGLFYFNLAFVDCPHYVKTLEGFDMTYTNGHQANRNTIYKIGGVTAIGAVLVGVAEIAITFLPSGNAPHETVLDWFKLFQENPFMGLRNLGLLNIFLNALGILTYYTLYATYRKSPYQAYAAFTALIFFLGAGVFFATNRAFPMLALSQQYTIATSDARHALEAAAQSMLSVGQSHAPGTFLAFFLTELAGVLISIIMLRSRVFSQSAAYAGILGFGMLLIFEYLSSFVTGLSAAAMILAMLGGILSMAWYIMIARRLFQLAKDPAN